jgi:hypothetical protein
MPWRNYEFFSGSDTEVLPSPPPVLTGNPPGQAVLPEAKPKNQQPQTPDTRIYGPAGTPIISGFVEDIQEYNPELRGRAALMIYEQMRRSDADVAAVLAACKLPIRGAEYKVMPGVDEGQPGYREALQVAKLCEDNLFGGLEKENSLGMKSSQRWESVIQNALLSLDYGCAGHEDIWTIDGNMVRLTKLAPRLPLTFYRFHIDPDGETLTSVEQWGYRGQDWVNVMVPADKFTLFVHDMEGANFYGKSLLRAAYQHWYIKQALQKIDAIACERNGVGIPHVGLAQNAGAPDTALATEYVENVSANENSGIVTPFGYTFDIKGVTGREHQILPSIQHQSEMICRSALAMFLTLGTSQSGSRALGNAHIDFFEMALQAEARFICDTISETTIRRWVDFNFPTKTRKIPYPRLQAPHIAVLNPLDLFTAFKDLASANVDILHPDDELENWVRDKAGAPRKGKPRPRFGPTTVKIQEDSEEPVNELEAEQQPDTPIGNQASKGAFSDRRVRLSRQLEGRLKWHGLDISIENAAGSTRSGKDQNGKPWSVIMQHPYGYLRRTEGVDGDHVDCFVGPDESAQYVYIVHQKDPLTGNYDEDKCLLDFPDAETAKAAFLANYNRPDFFHSMTVLPVAEFIEKVRATFDKPTKITAKELGGVPNGSTVKLSDKDGQTITIKVNGDDGSLRRMLEYIAKQCAIGHSFTVVVDPGDREYEKEFGFDGDGAARLELLRELELAVILAESRKVTTRALKPHELKHDFDGHARRQDATQTSIRRILGSAKPGLIREAARRAAQYQPQHLDDMRMPFDRGLTSRIAKSAGIAHRFGFDQVYAERYRATGKPKTQRAQLSAPAPAAAAKSSEQDKPGLIAEAAVSDLNNWITARARGAHVDAYKRGLREQDLYDAIVDELEGGADGALDRIGMEASRSAVTGGRYDAFQELGTEIDRYARSEAMDQNTCGPCEEGDGQEWDSLDDVDWSPGDDCDGKDACRGQLMPIFADEGTTELG